VSELEPESGSEISAESAGDKTSAPEEQKDSPEDLNLKIQTPQDVHAEKIRERCRANEAITRRRIKAGKRNKRAREEQVGRLL